MTDAVLNTGHDTSFNFSPNQRRLGIIIDFLQRWEPRPIKIGKSGHILTRRKG